MTTTLIATAALLALAVIGYALLHTLRQPPPPPNARHRHAPGYDPAATATGVIRRIDPRMLPDRRGRR